MLQTMTTVRRALWARWGPGVLAWALWVLAMLGVAASAWLDHLLRRSGRPDLTSLSAGAISSVLAVLSATTVGAVLAGRRPRHPVGWLLLALGLLVAASGVADGYQSYGLLAGHGSLPAVGDVAVLNPATLDLMLACVGFVL